MPLIVVILFAAQIKESMNPEKNKLETSWVRMVKMSDHTRSELRSSYSSYVLRKGCT